MPRRIRFLPPPITAERIRLLDAQPTSRLDY